MPYARTPSPLRATPLAVAFLTFLAISCPGWSKVVYVNKNAPGTVQDGASWSTGFTSVQPGIGAATSGDEVWVAAGTYIESVTLKSGTGLYGGFAGTETVRSQRVAGANVTSLDLFSAGGSVVTAPAGCGPDTVLDGFTISGGTGTDLGTTDSPWRGGGGVFCLDASPTISNNTISSNIAGGDALGPSSGYPTTTITGGGGGGGIFCQNSNAVITNNTIHANTAWDSGGGILCSGGAPTITGNVIQGNDATYPFVSDGGEPIGGTDGNGGGVYCDSTHAIFTGNTIAGNSALYCGGGLYVTGGSVSVSGNSVTGNSCSVGATALRTLDMGLGAGIFCNAGSFSGNFVSGNHATGSGGGLWARGTAAITDCTVTLNTPQGIDVANGATVSRCTISGNQNGVNCQAVISNCTISGNSAYGVYTMGTSSILSCTVTGNVSGGITVQSGPVGIANCTISGNYNGIDVWKTASITNCTVTANTWGGVRVFGGSAGVSNSIVAYNGRGIYRGSTTYPVNLSHNDFYGNTAGNYVGVPEWTGSNGNLAQDPKLSNIYHDIHIQPDSPCIDAGDVSALQPGWTDIDGQPRIIGAKVDIGSDESDGTFWTVPSRTWFVATTGDDANDGTSWARARKSVASAVAAAQGTDEVWVAKGTYPVNLSIASGVGLYGGFAGTETARNQRKPSGNSTILKANASNAITTQGMGITIDGFSIRGGSSGGLYTGVMTNGATVITNCTFSGLTVGLDVISPTTIANCTISGNSLRGIDVTNGSATVVNTVISDSGTGIWRGDSAVSVSVSHSDVYGNTAADYRNMTDPTGTNGNKSADPQFADSANGDFRLATGSPCIDAGDDAAVTPGSLDLDGKPRKIGAHADMGAYEFGAIFYTVADAAKALRMAGGLEAAPGDISRWNVVTGSSGVDVLDAVLIARKAAGLDQNP